MSEQCSWFGWLWGRVVLVAMCFIFLGLLLVGCQSDSVRRDLELEVFHYGMKALVEPGEPFEIDLFGNGAYPDAEWQIIEMDSEVIELRDTEYIPALSEGDWYSQGGSFLPTTIFWFTGGTLGESELVLEVQVDGQVVDRYLVTVAVVEDACDRPGEAQGIITANRCGG